MRESKLELLCYLMDHRGKSDSLSIQESLMSYVKCATGNCIEQSDDFSVHLAASYSVRDRLIDGWNLTNTSFAIRDLKRIYYLSMEFLMGRSL